ncbi:hypothetical protein FISHEDRAFT_70280 [Fistulina hepatica ATCC 64428]|uniref:F-box domain-containing protein n=1 Tax=Fistulina hepatica ATCC 64428 TaxID=1128425 RepID=A0A0D7AL66_9AGAR|nr:hypothetical protein FISHEDRAFT_70280 [Fistulina hepatica ATCC 64428]
MNQGIRSRATEPLMPFQDDMLIIRQSFMCDNILAGIEDSEHRVHQETILELYDMLYQPSDPDFGTVDVDVYQGLKQCFNMIHEIFEAYRPLSANSQSHLNIHLQDMLGLLSDIAYANRRDFVPLFSELTQTVNQLLKTPNDELARATIRDFIFISNYHLSRIKDSYSMLHDYNRRWIETEDLGVRLASKFNRIVIFFGTLALALTSVGMTIYQEGSVSRGFNVATSAVNAGTTTGNGFTQFMSDPSSHSVAVSNAIKVDEQAGRHFALVIMAWTDLLGLLRKLTDDGSNPYSPRLTPAQRAYIPTYLSRFEKAFMNTKQLLSAIRDKAGRLGVMRGTVQNQRRIEANHTPFGTMVTSATNVATAVSNSAYNAGATVTGALARSSTFNTVTGRRNRANQSNWAVDDSSALLRKTSEEVLYNMVEILTCGHCGHDTFPPLPTGSFDVHELKEVLRDGFLPSSLTMKCIEQEIANLEAMIKEVNDMLEDAHAALVQSLNPVVEYLAVARSVSSPIRRLPEELLSNIFSYLITPYSDENELQDAMFEAGILSSCGSTIHRLASVCKYWWRVVRDTPMLRPVVCVSCSDKGVLAVRRYIEMTSPHPLKFSVRGYFPFHSGVYTPQMEQINYCAIVQELVNASSRWQTADLERMSGFWLENASDIETEIAARIYRSSYPMLKELCLRSFPMSQFFSQEQVPALRITDLYLGFLNGINVDFDFHAILSCAPALSQLTVYSVEADSETYLSRAQPDTRSPVLLSHLRRLHVDFSIFMLNIITAPNLVHFRLGDDSLHSNLVDAFLHRSRCNIESLHLDILSTSRASSIVELSRQMPHVTHLAVSASQEIWVPFKERTPDDRFSVFPQLQHLVINDALEARVPLGYFRVVSEMMRVVRKRCGARKIRVEGHTGYRKNKKPPVLRRLDISCPLTPLQHRTLLALSECGALEVYCSVSGESAEYHSEDDGNDSDGEEKDSSDGDDDGVAYI